MIALIVIATGKRYWPYIDPLVASAQKYFLPHDVVLFTDDYSEHVPVQVWVSPQGYPLETLHRYHTILKYEETRFFPYDYLFYIDVDALFVAPVGEEVLADGITATRHAGYAEGEGAWEARPESMAYVALREGKAYYAGGFNGGTRDAYLNMAREIRVNVDCDAKEGVTAIWHDESHLNRYLYRHEPDKVLSPAYCYPEPQFLAKEGPGELLKGIEPKIICLEKSLHDRH